MGHITLLLQQASSGEEGARDELCSLVYDALYKRAEGRMRRERVDHTLEPTVLVHDAYMRLVGQEKLQYQDRNHFYALASREMRRILREYARRKRPTKISSEDLAAISGGEDSGIDTVAFLDALEVFESIDERAAKVVEMRILSGMKFKEIAEHLGVTDRTIRNDWRAGLAMIKEIIS